MSKDTDLQVPSRPRAQPQSAQNISDSVARARMHPRDVEVLTNVRRDHNGDRFPDIQVDKSQPDYLFLAAISASRMPMLLTDPNRDDNPIIFSNPAFQKLTGYSKDELLGVNCRFLQGPDTSRQTVDQIRSYIQKREGFECEILNYRKDGSAFWNNLFVTPVNDMATGNPLFYFASQVDVTSIREAESRARVANHMESLGQVTSGLIHDLKNLFQIILGYGDMLQTAIAAIEASPGLQLPKNAPRTINHIMNAAERASDLLNQLLAFSRRQYEPKTDVLDLSDTVAGFVRDLASRAIKTGENGEAIEIILNLSDDLKHVAVDRGQLEMATLNLLINARDAMPSGGRITVSTYNDTVEINRKPYIDNLPVGAYVCLSIRDCGTGIDPQVLPKVREPFFTTKPKGRGTGLGLATVQRFVEKSGGALLIDSKVGEGTTMRLYFRAANHGSDQHARNHHIESRDAL